MLDLFEKFRHIKPQIIDNWRYQNNRFMTKESDLQNLSEFKSKDVKSIEKFLPSQFVAWSRASK
jgi:hypothetical protein